MRVASWTPLELEDGIRSGNGEKRTSAHSLVCWERERAWIHVQGFRLSSSIRLTGFNITPLAKLHATANFCSMKKNLTVGFLREKRSTWFIPQHQKNLRSTFVFCPFLPGTWLTLHCIPKFEMHSYSSQFATCWEEEEKVCLAGEKIQWMRYRIALNLIFWCYVLTLYLNYVL